jgi:RNA polymerase sigma-70 factor (ECF subfamily)
VGDEQLLARARRGDEGAFSALFSRYQGPIYRYAVHMCGPEGGDDVVQETFLALLRQNGQFDATRGTLVQYLFGIARHIVMRHLATRYDTAFMDARDVEPVSTAIEQATVLDSLTRAETIDAVRTAVQSLPPPYREAVVLCELQEMGYADAAEIVGCPIGTIRSRLHRAKALLTAKLAVMQPVGCVRSSIRLQPDRETSSVRLEPDRETSSVRLEPDRETSGIRLRPERQD